MGEVKAALSSIGIKQPLENKRGFILQRIPSLESDAQSIISMHFAFKQRRDSLASKRVIQ
jgi:hypothetical protein